MGKSVKETSEGAKATSGKFSRPFSLLAHKDAHQGEGLPRQSINTDCLASVGDSKSIAIPGRVEAAVQTFNNPVMAHVADRTKCIELNTASAGPHGSTVAKSFNMPNR